MKKKKTKKLITSVVIVFVIAFLFIWNSLRIETEDVSVYMDGSYEKFYLGKEAKIFFDEYVDLSEYKDIDFHFSDKGRALLLSRYKYWSFYAVDVYYSEEKFKEIADSVFPDFGVSFPIEFDEHYDYHFQSPCQ